METLIHTIHLLDQWMHKNGTDPRLRRCLIQYANGQGFLQMEDFFRNKREKLRTSARDQDTLGWRRPMEGMGPKSLITAQFEHWHMSGEGPHPKKWASQLVVRLLKITHGQWIYRNVQVHESTCGTI